MNAEREAWREITMMECRISGDILKATACADEIVSKLKRFFRHEAAEKIRMAGSHPSLVGVRREVSEDYNAAADLIDSEVKS